MDNSKEIDVIPSDPLISTGVEKILPLSLKSQFATLNDSGNKLEITICDSKLGRI